MNVRVVLQKLIRLAREEDASSLVEFAVTALALLSLLFGVIACGFAAYSYHFVAYAADQGASFAQLRGYTWSKDEATNCSTSAPPSFSMAYDCTASSGDVQNFIQSLASGGISTTNITVTTTWTGKNADNTTTGCTANSNAQGCLVKVQVTYNFNILPFPHKLDNLSLSATSVKAIVQ